MMLRAIHVRLAAAIGGALLPLLIAAPALAQTATTHEVGGVAGYGAWDWISLVLRMGAVLLVIWGSVVGMRWYVRRMNGEGNGGMTRAMQIIETRALGPSRALHLVRLGDRAVLIGATPERINALMEIDDPEQLEQIFAGGDEPQRRGVPGFEAGLAMLAPLAERARHGMQAWLDARSAGMVRSHSAVNAADPAVSERPVADRATPATLTSSGASGMAAWAAPALPALPEPSAAVQDSLGAMPAAAAPQATRRAIRPAGLFTNALIALGRRMQGAPRAPRVSGHLAPASAAASNDPVPDLPASLAALAALEAAVEERSARVTAARGGVGSLFDRTLADAQRTQVGPRGAALPEFDRAPSARRPLVAPDGPVMSAAGLRARTGYQAVSSASGEEIEREARIAELQRAIAAARRNAG